MPVELPLRCSIANRCEEDLSLVETRAIVQAVVEPAPEFVQQVPRRCGAPITVVSAAPVVNAGQFTDCCAINIVAQWVRLWMRSLPVPPPQPRRRSCHHQCTDGYDTLANTSSGDARHRADGWIVDDSVRNRVEYQNAVADD